MKVTLDSSEPLADVMRVVGSLYGVTLTTTDHGSGDVAAGSESSRRATSAKRATPSSRRKASKTPDDNRVDPKLVRQWAQDNGHDVNARGSLPAAVREAYAAANPN